jgi:NAD(P)-dependent dehydrogenase (short-subunit alcohol dehydrogenase family)
VADRPEGTGGWSEGRRPRDWGAIALSLADAGARVAVIARSAGELGETVRLIEEKSGTAKAFPADVTEAAALAPIFCRNRALSRTARRVVQQCRDSSRSVGPFVQADAEQWWRALEVNLREPVLCAHAVLPGMAARRRGSIVNVASGAGDMAISYFSEYVASKIALIRFTECLAAEMWPYGVAVFALGPGTVCTAMFDYSLNSPEGKNGHPGFDGSLMKALPRLRSTDNAQSRAAAGQCRRKRTREALFSAHSKGWEQSSPTQLWPPFEPKRAHESNR